MYWREITEDDIVTSVLPEHGDRYYLVNGKPPHWMRDEGHDAMAFLAARDTTRTEAERRVAIDHYRSLAARLADDTGLLDTVEQALCAGGEELFSVHVTHPEVAQRVTDAVREWLPRSTPPPSAPVTFEESPVGTPTNLTVLEAAGKTLEELQAHFRCELLHEEDPTDPRPCVRILRFANLTQAVEFAQLFDPGAHADVWFTDPTEVDTLFDQRVRLSVVFHTTHRPATLHGEDDMRNVIESLRH